MPDTTTIPFPQPGDYNPDYDWYINEIAESDILELLERQKAECRALFASIPEKNGDFRYAEGKWSVKDVLQHLCDNERVFAYRALVFSRGDEVELPGYEQDDWAAATDTAGRTLAGLRDEFLLLREATLVLLRPLTAAQWRKRGAAYGAPLTVNAIPYILAGHYRHHETVLRERYGAAFNQQNEP